MRRLIVFALLLLVSFTALPARAQLQYFGYVGGADDDQALSRTYGYTNFAHISATVNPADTFLRDRVTALAQKGSKAVIDLGLVLWCDYYGEQQKWRYLCNDWLSRWNQWKSVNASILTSDKVLAFSIRDEPFNYDVSMTSFEQAAAQVKADLPWAKLYVTEAACVITDDNCGIFPGSGAFNNYHGTLPNIDWIGVDDYAIHPATDPTFQSAVSQMKTRFPGRKWLYTLDGWWSDDHPARCRAKCASPSATAPRSASTRRTWRASRRWPTSVAAAPFTASVSNSRHGPGTWKSTPSRRTSSRERSRSPGSARMAGTASGIEMIQGGRVG